jgi:SAM-dependent methyltransferase
MPPRDAREFFHGYAVEFSDIYGGGRTPWSRLINRAFRASMRLRFERSLQSCEPVADKSILDVGCGPGHYVVALAQAGARRVVGVDSAPAMIELSRERALRAGVAHLCEFHCVPLEQFHTGERFDHAICMGLLEYLASPRPAIASILGMTRLSALFSLPDRRGVLAWQRRVRYRFKTPLYMYREAEVAALFAGLPGVGGIQIDRLRRDFFVTLLPGPGAEGSPAGGRS